MHFVLRLLLSFEAIFISFRVIALHSEGLTPARRYAVESALAGDSSICFHGPGLEHMSTFRRGEREKTSHPSTIELIFSLGNIF